MEGEPKFRFCEDVAHSIARYLPVNDGYDWMWPNLVIDHTHGACVDDEIYIIRGESGRAESLLAKFSYSLTCCAIGGSVPARLLDQSG
jgi:hypothetical protein